MPKYVKLGEGLSMRLTLGFPVQLAGLIHTVSHPFTAASNSMTTIWKQALQ